MAIGFVEVLGFALVTIGYVAVLGFVLVTNGFVLRTIVCFFTIEFFFVKNCIF